MKSVSFQSKLLSHIFMQAPLSCPCTIYLELLYDELPGAENIPADVEIQNLSVVGYRVPVQNWTKIEATLSPGESQAPKIYNTDEIILPFPADESTWLVTHVALWAETADETYLLYYFSLEDTVSISKDEPKSFKPGDLLLTE